MTGIPDFTTVVAVGKEHLPELAAVFPTWWHFKPEIFQRPLWVVRDAGVETGDILRAVRGCVDGIWDIPEDFPGFLRNSDRLRAAAYLSCAAAPTRHYLQLASGIVAVTPGEWIDPAWFDSDFVLVGSPWCTFGTTEFAACVSRDSPLNLACIWTAADEADRRVRCVSMRDMNWQNAVGLDSIRHLAAAAMQKHGIPVNGDFPAFSDEGPGT